MQTGSRSEWPIVARDDELRQALAALEDDAEFQGVALVGDSGVGKSTLARALADTLESGGSTARFALGTQTGCAIPLGAFFRSVTVEAAHEPAAMLAAAHKTLEREENLVVVVDDAQLLDPLSSTLVHQLAASGSARLIVTIRSGDRSLRIMNCASWIWARTSGNLDRCPSTCRFFRRCCANMPLSCRERTTPACRIAASATRG